MNFHVAHNVCKAQDCTMETVFNMAKRITGKTRHPSSKVKQILTAILTMGDGLRIILASGLACTWWAGLGEHLVTVSLLLASTSVCLLDSGLVWLRRKYNIVRF